MGKLSLLLCVALSSYIQVSHAGKLVLEKGTKVCDIHYERNNVCDITNVGLKVRQTSIRSCKCADRAWMRCEQTTRSCRPAPSTIVALGTAAKEPEPVALVTAAVVPEPVALGTEAKVPEPVPEVPAAVVSVEIPSETSVVSEFAIASEAATDVMLGHKVELEVTNEGLVPAAPLEEHVVVVPHEHIHDDNDPTDHLHHEESTKEITVEISTPDVTA